MAQYLLKTVETYRVGDEAEAEKIVKEAKNNNTYTLVKYEVKNKEVKLKGEVVDEYTVVTLTKKFNDEKDPDGEVDISYTTYGNFPKPIEE